MAEQRALRHPPHIDTDRERHHLRDERRQPLTPGLPFGAGRRDLDPDASREMADAVVQLTRAWQPRVPDNGARVELRAPPRSATEHRRQRAARTRASTDRREASV